MVKGYNVYLNDQYVTFISGRSHASLKRFIKDGSIMIGTHMGEWKRVLTLEPSDLKKTAFEWEYATTVGKYIVFKPAFI